MRERERERKKKSGTLNSKDVNRETHWMSLQATPKFALEMSVILFALMSLRDWIKIQTTCESNNLRRVKDKRRKSVIFHQSNVTHETMKQERILSSS